MGNVLADTAAFWSSPRWLALAPVMMLANCAPAKSVDFYRENSFARDKMVNQCLHAQISSDDCDNAIMAEAKSWATRQNDGLPVNLDSRVAVGKAPSPARTLMRRE